MELTLEYFVEQVEDANALMAQSSEILKTDDNEKIMEHGKKIVDARNDLVELSQKVVDAGENIVSVQAEAGEFDSRPAIPLIERITEINGGEGCCSTGRSCGCE